MKACEAQLGAVRWSGGNGAEPCSLFQVTVGWGDDSGLRHSTRASVCLSSPGGEAEERGVETKQQSVGLTGLFQHCELQFPHQHLSGGAPRNI